MGLEVIYIEGNIENIKAKWSGSQKSVKRQAAKDRIKNAYSSCSAEVEVIPAKSELKSNEPKITRVAAYCRVSTDEDAQSGSYELQVQYYSEYIKNHLDWEFVGIYADEGMSGTNATKGSLST
jgi:site-specific DNA recombinase